MRLQKRTFISCLILFIFLILLMIIYYPNPRLTSEIKITDEISNQYLLRVNFPEKIWLGQSEKINVELIKDNSQNGLINKKFDLTDVESQKNQNLEVDLVITGAILNPPGNSITPIIDGKNISMNWRIEPITNQKVNGAIWVYINTISDDENNENQEKLVFNRNISIKIKKLVGMKIGSIRWILSFFTLCNFIYLFRFFRKDLRPKRLPEIKNYYN